ncbi:hypothetical protein Tco_0662434 [Tanacetum coccineum]
MSSSVLTFFSFPTGAEFLLGVEIILFPLAGAEELFSSFITTPFDVSAFLVEQYERISKKRTKNEAKTTKQDTEWKSVEKTKSRQSPSADLGISDLFRVYAVNIKLWYDGCRDGGDSGGGGGVVEITTAVGGWLWWRVKESEVVGWIDRLTRSIFGVHRKTPPEKFSGGGAMVADGGRVAGDFEADYSAIVYNDALTSNENVPSKPPVSIYNAIKANIDFNISFSDSDDEDYTCICDKNSFSYKLILVNDLKPEPVNDHVEIKTELCSKNIDIKPMDSVVYIINNTTPVEPDECLETNHNKKRELSEIKDIKHGPYSKKLQYAVSNPLDTPYRIDFPTL